MLNKLLRKFAIWYLCKTKATVVINAVIKEGTIKAKEADVYLYQNSLEKDYIIDFCGDQIFIPANTKFRIHKEEVKN